MKYLALDYGTKKIGLAHSLENIALPLGIISTSSSIAELKKIVSKRGIEAFVIGIPNHITGEESDLTKLVREYEKSLKTHFPDLPIFEYDERLSSAEALLSLQETGHKTHRREKLDDMAAAIVLQSFLESRK